MARSFDTLDLVAAHRRLQDLFDERPHLAARAEDVTAFQSYDQRAVFRLTWDGRPAIAKLIWHSQHAKAVSGQTSALKQMALTLAGRPAHVPQVLHFAPKVGFFVISFIEGKTAFELLRTRGEKALPEVVEAARLWLSEASHDSRRAAPFPIAEVEHKLAAYADGPAKAIVARIRALLKTAPDSLTISAGHGDFWPGNLILGPDGVTGIDLSAHRNFPMMLDITRFIRGLNEHCENGVPEALKAPLLSLLPQEEVRRSFDLFYGLSLAEKLHAADGQGYAREVVRFLEL